MSVNRKGIPEDAKKVFEGVIFDIYQWEQRMFDGSMQTFERLKRPNTAQVIATVGDQILVQTEEQPDAKAPFTSLPGGRFDPGEEALAAAQRELLEETGYRSDDWTLWHESNPVGKIDWTVYTFIARNCVQSGEIHLDAGEKITSRLVTLEDFLALAEDPLFYSPEIVPELLGMQLHSERKEAFRTMLFGA